MVAEGVAVGSERAALNVSTSRKKDNKFRPCLPASMVTLALGSLQQEGYPGTRTFLLISNDAFTRQLELLQSQGNPGALVNDVLGTTCLLGTTLFWLPIVKYVHNTDKISEIRPRKHQVLSQFIIFLLWKEIIFQLCYLFVISLNGNRSGTSVKPWPNGVASRRKLKTQVYLRLRLARPCEHLR